MSVTVYDIAAKLKVSQTTVSRVLNKRNDAFISEATKERVRAAAREMGYRPNRLAKALASGSTQTIGLLSPHSYFHFQVAYGAENEAGNNSYRVIRGHAHSDFQTESHQIEMLLEHCIDGLILVAGRLDHTGDYFNMISEAGIPCITLDEEQFADRVDSVVSDDMNGAKMAVEHLLSLGHTRIGHIGAQDAGSTGRNRRIGYEIALMGAGFEVDESLVVGSRYDPDMAGQWLYELLDLPNPPTAVFIANDLMAAKAMLAAKKRGVRIPEDLALVGYGDTEVSEFTAMTTISQHADEMGRVAFRRLVERIGMPELEPKLIQVPTSLIVRETCGAEIH